MKVKLLTFWGLMVVPFLSYGQTVVPALYNKGKMSVIAADTTKTTLFIGGNFVAGGDATTKSDIFVNGSKTVLTGDFVQNAELVPGANNTVFSTTKGATPSKIVFRGTTAQEIKTDLTAYNSLRKGANYISFPDIEVVNSNGVTIVPELGASVQNLILTKGKLVLDSRRMAAGDITTNSAGATNAPDVDNSSLMAHLRVDGNVTYNRNAATLNDKGVVEVRVALDPLKGTGYDEHAGRSIVGMGSPYKKVFADYFMWNTLMLPYGNNIIGKANATERDPQVGISAGQGFVLGVDLKGTNAANYEPDDTYEETSFADRNVEMLKFNRFSFNNNNNLYPNSLSTNVSNGFANVDVNTNDHYTGEELNTTNVVLPLLDGYNYLANPFTSPLDLKELVNPSGGTNPWDVTPSANSPRDILNKVWVLNPSSKASSVYNLSNGAQLYDERVYVSYTYLLMQSAGSTYTDGANNGYVVAPLQMFVIWKPTGSGKNTITIPTSQRKIDAGSHFLRAATIDSDDYLFQVSDLSMNVFDRAAVVLRTPQEILSNAEYTNVAKMVTSVSSVDNSAKSALQYRTTQGDVNGNLGSVLYTKDTEGKALESMFLPTPEGATEVTTGLYLKPSIKSQDIAINAMRLNTKDRVNAIFLKDKLTGKEFLLSSGQDYKTTIKPNDDPDRFTLRFVLSSSGVGEEIQSGSKSINSYYANGTLTVSGFEDADMGSTLSVYDIQGRLLHQLKVNELTMNVQDAFTPGAYIVKVIGNKSYVSKFLAK